MTAPGMARRLQEIRQRGGKVILIDPRYNETARFADRHLFIRPGTDVLLLLSLLHVVFDERLEHFDQLAPFTKGVETVAKLVADFPPERVATITGIAANEIRLLAREFASAGSAVCYGRIGLSTQEFGGDCQWLINVLNIVTGNLDRPGGAARPRRPVAAARRATGDRQAAGDLRTREGGLRTALRAQQPPRLGGDPRGGNRPTAARGRR